MLTVPAAWSSSATARSCFDGHAAPDAECEDTASRSSGRCASPAVTSVARYHCRPRDVGAAATDVDDGAWGDGAPVGLFDLFRRLGVSAGRPGSFGIDHRMASSRIQSGAGCHTVGVEDPIDFTYAGQKVAEVFGVGNLEAEPAHRYKVPGGGDSRGENVDLLV